MCNKRTSQSGVTLVEMIVTIALFGVMTAVGSLLISKIAPSYSDAVQAEQALSPREAALWRISEDFHRSLVYGTSPSGCTSSLNLNVASGVAGVMSELVVSQVVTYWLSGTTTSQLWLSAPWVSGMLLNNVTSPNSCIFNWQPGAGSTPTKLNVAFTYTVENGAEALAIPTSMTLYTYAAAPYAPYLAPSSVSALTPTTVSISGVGLTGMTSVAISGATVFYPSATVLNDSVISATVNSPTTGVFDLVVTTPEGKTTLVSAIIFD